MIVHLFDNLKCILYDENNMRLYEAIIKSVSGEASSSSLNCEAVFIYEPTEIELDPTTMIRIAQYNKSKELEEINDEIKRKKRELKELQNQTSSLNTKLEAIQDYLIDNDYRMLQTLIDREDDIDE